MRPPQNEDIQVGHRLPTAASRFPAFSQGVALPRTSTTTGSQSRIHLPTGSHTHSRTRTHASHLSPQAKAGVPPPAPPPRTGISVRSPRPPSFLKLQAHQLLTHGGSSSRHASAPFLPRPLHVGRALSLWRRPPGPWPPLPSRPTPSSHRFPAQRPNPAGTQSTSRRFGRRVLCG